MEVYSLLEKKRKGAVYIYGDNMDDVLGIITFAQVRRFLLEGNIN